jgi:hypothetical protein
MFGTQVQSTGSDRKQQYKELSKECSMYDPCPICFKCQNKATHLYKRCEECPLDFCGHNHKQRSFIIRRENFGITVTNETKEEFLKLSEKLREAERCTCGDKGDEDHGA